MISVTLTIGPDTFTYEGRREDASFFLRIWLNARHTIPPPTDMTPEERTAVVAALTKEAQEIFAAADALDAITRKLNTTAQGE